MSISLGYGNIKGFVFEDLDGNGLQGQKEHGLGAVKVQLIDWHTRKVISTTTTNFAGEYHFKDVVAGHQYKVKFINPKPGQYMFSDRNIGRDRTIDSDGPISGKFTVTAGKTITNIDAGLFKKAKIGDFVFHDVDGDGKQDPAEKGIGGIKIQLLNDSGESIRQTISDKQGRYSFNHLNPGEYQVKFLPKDGYHFSPRRVGQNPALDSDGPISNLIHLKSGDWNPKIDAGLYRPAKVGDFVWEDLDGDGIQDNNEPGIEGVTVKLTRPNGRVVNTTTTDQDGLYLFDKVRPGNYRVMFNNPDDNLYKFTTSNAGNDDTADSDANITTGQTPVFRLKSGGSNLTLDAGLMRKNLEKAKLGDVVFNDLNQNGIQETGEPGIAGASIKLQSSNGTTLNTTTTNALGMYMFNNLAPGDYKVMFVQPNGFDGISPFLSGGDNRIDSDADPSNGLMSELISLEPGEFNDTIDAGFFMSLQPDIDIEKYVRVIPANNPGQAGQDICDTVGKPQTILLQYIPGTEFNTQQSSKKGEGLVNNGLDDDGTSFVVVSEKENGEGDIYFSGNVSIGEIFEANSSKFSSNTFFSLFDDEGGPLLQSGRYHTSCSAPIVLGDEIFSLTLVGIEGEDGDAFLPTPTDFVDADTAPGPEAAANSTVEFRYEITNTGDSPLANIQVTDDRLSTLNFEGGDDNNNNLLDLDETWTYSASEKATGEGVITNKGTVTGESNGITVMDMDPANYTVIENPPLAGDVCDVLGKPEALSFTYRSDDDANFGDLITNQKSGKAILVGNPDDDGLGYVVVSNGKFKSGKSGKSGKSSKGGRLNGSSIFFEGTVSEGENFRAAGDFKSQTLIQVFEDETAFNSGAAALQSVEYHTSCSQPIQIGDQLGSVLLSGYQGEDGSTGILG